jgi:hypothetical protein
MDSAEAACGLGEARDAQNRVRRQFAGRNDNNAMLMGLGLVVAVSLSRREARGRVPFVQHAGLAQKCTPLDRVFR